MRRGGAHLEEVVLAVVVVVVLCEESGAVRIVNGRGARDDLGRPRVEVAQVEGEAVKEPRVAPLVFARLLPTRAAMQRRGHTKAAQHGIRGREGERERGREGCERYEGYEGYEGESARAIASDGERDRAGAGNEQASERERERERRRRRRRRRLITAQCDCCPPRRAHPPHGPPTEFHPSSVAIHIPAYCNISN